MRTWIAALLLSALSGTALCADAGAPDEISSTYTVPPRRADDVLRMLDHYRPDPVQVERAQAIAAAQAPEGVSRQDLVDFHRRRAIANARLGRHEAQVKELQAAIELAEPNTPQRAGLLGALATAESTGGNLLSAARASDAALAQLPPGNAGRQLALLQAAVKFQVLLGNFSVARDYLQRAEAVFNRLRSAPRWPQRGAQWTAQIHRARAELFVSEGRLVEAEGAYRKALAAYTAGMREDAADESGEDRVERYDGLIERSLANVLLAQGKVAEAEFHLRHALHTTLTRMGRDSVDVAHSLSLLSKILAEQGRNEEATRTAEAALRAYTEAGASALSFNLVRARQTLAAALSAQGRHAEAIAAFERNRTVLGGDPQLLQRYGIGHPEWVISLIGVGRLADAEQMANTMLQWSVARFGDDNPRAALRRALLAVVKTEQGAMDEARHLFQASVPTLLNQAREDTEAETATPRKQRHLVLILEAWLRALTAGTPDAGRIAEAFRVADLARGSSVARALTAAAARADLPDPALAALARQAQDAQRRLASLSGLLIQLLAAPPNEQLPAIQGQLRQDIAVVSGEYDALRRQIGERYPDYAALVQPQAASLDELQSHLRSGEALLAFYVGARESYLWAVNALGQRHFSRIAATRAEVDATVAGLRRALDPGVASIDALPAFDLAAAHALFGQFIAPAAEVWRPATTLLVVPHGALAQLPISLLPTQPSRTGGKTSDFSVYREVAWLVRSHAVQQLPSATALASLRRAPARAAQPASFAGFGDPLFSAQQAPVASAGGMRGAARSRSLALRGSPQFAALDSASLADLPPLPDTREELLAVARALGADPLKDVFLQREATERRVREMNLVQRRVIMFATHGLVPGDLDGLTQPALALTSPAVVPDAGNGLLTMDDVLSLKLDADWIVLSACNTAAGEGAGAEAVSGLGRAFFYAGARAMLVSNWPVETSAARLLMTAMFAEQGANPSLAKAEALRRAMLKLIDGQGLDRAAGGSLQSYAHPLFWAPFVIVGD